ncbi:integrase arm-type DNA-binding domain-containing protein [Paraburkholderia sp. SARCC-3016]|uniref:tyrosine-type recombinase/integrase n=1 Tax=Paraburkholderia sp. SARCC-3016 TaxID=3058611 RepID=UPI0028095CC6|nr:integrase arm-type DNA-binding domain-containing protein [Paraburkholderia sp. SARCC-3016]MDQ7978694.1 integrase arm-type DNA-binding domain-containing protein [Paraburkholderia sp. SARCC-3016]
MPKIAKELGALAVSRLKEPGMHAVGKIPGLYLQVSDKGSRSWILRVTVGTHRREIGLGSYPAVPLKDAHAKAQAERDKVRRGVDPVIERRAAESALRVAQASEITFADAAKRFIDDHSEGWKNAKHGDQWKNTLAQYAEPVIGKMFVRHITRDHVLQVLKPIWTSKTETASRLRGRIENVLDWARVMGYRSGENPALWRGNLDHLLAKPSKIKQVRHHPALPYQEMGDFMTELRAIDATGAKCLEFTILSVARSGESRGARKSEFDIRTGVWIVPPGRMKLKKEHRVPLPKAAIDLLLALPHIDWESSEDCLVFPSPRGKVLSDMTLLMVVRRLGAAATPHGMRSTFRDWASDITNHPRELIEVALSHVPGDASEMAYWRSDVLERRRQIMEDWAQFISRPYKTDNVLPLQRQA